MRKRIALLAPLIGGIVTATLALTSNCSAKRPPAFDQDLSHLAQLIELPIAPKEAWFGKLARGKASSAPGPTDWIFVAVMRFEPQILQNFLASATLEERKPAQILRAEVAPWFPKEIALALTPLDDQHYQVRGRKFTATPFPAKSGTLSDHGGIGSFFVIDGLPFVVLRRAL